MLDLRAVIKMYSPDTPLPQGPNPNKVEKAEKQLGKLERILRESAHKLDDKAGGSTDVQRLEVGSWQCNSAFIIFNHEESYRRCIRDYSSYNR
jgi:hypothetical protein